MQAEKSGFYNNNFIYLRSERQYSYRMSGLLKNDEVSSVTFGFYSFCEHAAFIQYLFTGN